MEIVEEEAVIVRRIYTEFLAGKSTYDIAARLTEDGIPTPAKRTTCRHNQLSRNTSCSTVTPRFKIS